jgi:hypothetical protein
MNERYATHTDFIVPPECQGQIVEYSYATGGESPVVIIERRWDRSDGSVQYEAYEDGAPDGDFDPWNGAPCLGRSLGPCDVEAAE